MSANALVRDETSAQQGLVVTSREIHPRLHLIASLMDDFIPIPGTNFKIGLDGIIGLVPFVGDIATILIGGLFIQEAQRLGASRWTLARMYGNYAIDLLVGIIPFVGDAFDFGFKAHRRNLRLLQEHLDRRKLSEERHFP